MAEDLKIDRNTSKEEQYKTLVPQIKALLEGETDLVANLANICAALKEQFNWFWVGFYLVKEADLVLGPFQGPVACTRIRKGKGVCGTSWEKAETLIVPDVDKFPDILRAVLYQNQKLCCLFYRIKMWSACWISIVKNGTGLMKWMQNIYKKSFYF